MATSKIFDIIIRSKHTPEGIRGALAGLKSIGEAGFFIRQGLIAPLMEGGRVLLDFIGAANPERVKELSDAFGEVKTAIGSLLDDVLGPTISELSRLIRQATLLTNASKNLEPVYQSFFETMKREGKDAAEIVDEIGSASKRAVDQLAEGIRQNPLATIGVQAKDAAISTEQFRDIILSASGSLREYLALLKQAGLGYQDLQQEINRFNQAKGIEPFDPEAVEKGKGAVRAAWRKGEDEITKTRQAAGLQRTRLLEDIAVREGDRLADLARRNVQQMADIDAQRTQAIQQANADLAAQLANIDRESSRSRIRIEEDYQERLRQIRQSSDQTIEETIRRRDARGLAQALNARKEQIDSATRDRDKSQRDNAESADQQRKAAEEQAKEMRRQAEESARRTVEMIRKQSEEAAQEAVISYGRQERDFDTNTRRRLEDTRSAGSQELTAARNNLTKIEAAWKIHFANVNRIIETETAENSALFVHYKNFIVRVFEEVLGMRLPRPTAPR